jgi:hypothetical protein
VSALASSALAVEVDYTRDIKPLLTTKCAACHGALRQEAGMRLDAGSLVLAGSENGAVVVPGDAAASLIIQRVSAADSAERMPPEGEGEPLDAAQIALLTEWIDSGARYPAEEAIPTDPAGHWAYQPVRRTVVPVVSDPDWSGNPIDAFIAEQHAVAGITPVSEGDQRTLLRRVYLDLIGLPPTRADQTAFLADDGPDAWEHVVDQLLTSELHAERWARQWMDVWRYSDWDGYGKELRGSQRHLWRWRDWIVDSLAADKPYDEMVCEMLAADELRPADANSLRATGFLARQHYKLNRDLWLDNTVEHTFKAFLGMTLNCSKCHDHKYDPLPQTDYYAARAIFEPYQVRIDRVAGEADVEKDGLTRSYDADAEKPTYLYVRGNEKQPDEEHPIAPAVPAILGGGFSIESMPLPLEAWYPDLANATAADAVIHAAEQKRDEAREQLEKAQREHAGAVERLAYLERATHPSDAAAAGTVILDDLFAEERPELWTQAGGEWTYTDGVLRQSAVVAERSELIARVPQPQNFVARVKFRNRGGQMWHSVGLSFDRIEAGDCDGVYLSAVAGGSKVQVVHVRDGQSSYPSVGAQSLPVELNRDYELTVAVRDALVNVSIDGALVLVYRLIGDRRAGQFSLWTFDARAEFVHAELRELPTDFQLAEMIADQRANSPDRARLAIADAEALVGIAEKKLEAAQLNVESLLARLAADRATVSEPESSQTQELAVAAAGVERRHALCAAELRVAEQENELRKAKRDVESGGKPEDVRQNAEKGIEAAIQKRDEAAAACEKTDGEYTPFGTRYPQTSSGRRTALARWITSRENPLTARVAVNHIWLRHFGSPLVENVFDFGLRTPEPVHHELLDWLAAELMDSGWSMRHIHRLIVTSRTYRLSSSATNPPGMQPLGLETDPENRLYWRANVQRLDAEVIRDCVLFVGGSLDTTRGGPEIDFTQGETVFRRSLYFRHAYEKQMRFLTIFDAASPNECYRRSESILPQQALALANSELSAGQSRQLAARLSEEVGGGRESDSAFVTAAFETALCRPPTDEELTACQEYLDSQTELLRIVPPSIDPAQRSRAGLVHVLLNHNDFVTAR